jgi:hypothetical protein
MLHNKQKVICHTLIIAVTIVLLGSSSYSSSVFAFPFQSTIHHHKVFDKKQDSGSNPKDARNGGDSSDNSDSSRASSTSDTKSSDSSNNLASSDNNNRNNDQGTNDGSNTGAHNNLQAVEPAKTSEQQGTAENIPSSGTATPIPQTTCEQGSNCTDQQGLSDHDRSTTASTTPSKQEDTPFVLSLPFP